MALIQCSECNREISEKASSCPGCGAPVNPQDSGPGKSNLTTVQETSKKLKGQIIFSIILIILGMAGCLGSQEASAEFQTGSILFVLGITWWMVTKIRIWWHHS